MDIPRLKYQNEKWDVNLPSIRAYTFNQSEIDSFIQNGTVPFDFDTNLNSTCNANCIYCATQGGKSDVRFPYFDKFPKLRDKDISEMIRQLNILGTKTFFLCSNGEPLLNQKRFLKILDEAGDREMNVITYTNGTTLSKDFLKELHKRKVNLVMKLESFDSILNNEIIFGKNNSKNAKLYSYGLLNNQEVPEGIIAAFDIYGTDSDCLGIETMILKKNINELLEIRDWAYSLKCSQFLKHLYPLGYAELRGEEIMPNKDKESELIRKIFDLDSKHNFVYPSFHTPDYFSYDVRRFMNNCISLQNFPFRMFAHETGGVYHSSQIVPKKFGFEANKVVSVFDSDGRVNMKQYFEKIREYIQDE